LAMVSLELWRLKIILLVHVIIQMKVCFVEDPCDTDDTQIVPH
jgi:hypothetical protein